jgi:cytochrome c553
MKNKLNNIFLIFLIFQTFTYGKVINFNSLEPDIQAAIKRCSECHGLYGEKRALHRSIPINTLSKEAFLGRLRGYMKLTYGGELKAFMRSRIAYLNKRQLTKIAEYYTSPQHRKNSDK